MAKKKTRAKTSTKTSGIGSSILRGLAGIWRGLAKYLGKSIRFVAKGAKDLDPAHQRDGFAFLLLILAIMAAAGTWFDGGNIVSIGGQAGISGHLRIGNNVKIGGKSGVIKDILEKKTVMGYPATEFRDFIKKNKDQW